MLWATFRLQNYPPGLLGLAGCQFCKQSIQMSLHEGVNEEWQLRAFLAFCQQWISNVKYSAWQAICFFAEIKWNHLENYVCLLL